MHPTFEFAIQIFVDNICKISEPPFVIISIFNISIMLVIGTTMNISDINLEIASTIAEAIGL